MLPTTLTQDTQIADEMNIAPVLRFAVLLQPEAQLYQLLSCLSQDPSWSARKAAAQKLGDYQDHVALQGLLDKLPVDPFWKVRCTIIQALERIGDSKAIPVLQEVARKDGFQVVRSYAAKAVERLS